MHGLHIAGAPLDYSGVVLTIIRSSYIADDKGSMLPSQLVLRLDCIKYFCYASSSALYTGGEKSVMRFTYQTRSIAGHFHNSLAHQTLKGRDGVLCPLELGCKHFGDTKLSFFGTSMRSRACSWESEEAWWSADGLAR